MYILVNIIIINGLNSSSKDRDHPTRFSKNKATCCLQPETYLKYKDRERLTVKRTGKSYQANINHQKETQCSYSTLSKINLKTPNSIKG